MIRRALAFIVCNGPASDQDRWEEDAGINTFTLAACIAALVCGARYLEPEARELALAVADYWNASLEDWTAVTGTPLCGRHASPVITCAWRRGRRCATGVRCSACCR